LVVVVFHAGCPNHRFRALNQFAAPLYSATAELLLRVLSSQHLLSSFCNFCFFKCSFFQDPTHPLLPFSLFFFSAFPTSSPYVFFPSSKQLHMSSICVGYGAKMKRCGAEGEIDEVLLLAPFLAPNSHFLGRRQGIEFLSLFSFSLPPPHSQHALCFPFAPRDLVEVKNLGWILGVSPARQELGRRSE
jgi:hypothetical protein